MVAVDATDAMGRLTIMDSCLNEMFRIKIYIMTVSRKWKANDINPKSKEIRN